MKKNDKVITHAGIYGKVIAVTEKEDEIVVEIDDKVRVKMVKNAILRNLTNEETSRKPKPPRRPPRTRPRAAIAAPEPPASTAVTAKKDDPLKF